MRLLSYDEFRQRWAFGTLNTIRVLNILVFADIVVSAAIMIFKINKLNNFYIFEAITHFVVGLVSRNYLPPLQW